MNYVESYGESVRVAASVHWNISIGGFNHISISDASANMVRNTAIVLSKAYPAERVAVKALGRIRWIFENGEEVNALSPEAVKTLCPFDSARYADCWERGVSFPVATWVEVRKDGTKSIL